MNTWLSIILAYLIGNFSASFLVGKMAANIDIRNYGSGNAGSTNVFRTLGLKAGAWAFFGDSLKGVVAVTLGWYLGGERFALLSGLAVIVGHNWPALLKFKGGKGIATSIGVILVLHPISAIISVLIGILILYRYKYVSLASVIAMVFLPIILYYFKGNTYFLFGLILAVMAVYRHRGNIKRLLNGTESKITKKS